MYKKLIYFTLFLTILLAASTAVCALDLMPPQVNYGYNPFSGPLSWPNKIAGSASDLDDPARIDLVHLNIRRDSDNKYWNGADWSSSVPVMLFAVIESPGVPTTGWHYNISSSNLNEGSYTTHVWASNIRSGPAVDLSFTYDNTNPQNPTSCQVEGHPEIISNATWTNLSSPTFILIGATDNLSGVYKYYYYFGTDPAGIAITSTLGDRVSVAATTTGTNFLRIKTEDRAGNQSGWATLFTYKYDGAAPADFNLTYPLPGAYLATNRPAFSWGDSSDSHSGVNRFEIYIDSLVAPAATLPPATTNYTPTTSLSEGPHYWLVKCIDNAGNAKDDVNGDDPIVPGKASFTVDLTPPTAIITSPTDNYVTSRPTFSIFGPAADNIKLSTAEVLVNGAVVWSNPALTGTSYTLSQSIPLAREGSNTVVFRVKDAAGNTRENSITVIYDPTAPESFNLVSPANNAWTNTANAVLTWQEPQDLISGIESYNIYVDGVKKNTTTVTDETFTVSDLSEGRHQWFIEARDRAGNTNISEIWNINIDNTPPSIPLLVSPLNDAVNHELTFSWSSCTDTPSGIAGYDLYINSVKKATVSENSTTLTEPLADGIYSWYVEARDLAGNTARSSSRTFIVNEHGPDISVTVDGNPLVSGAALRSAPKVTSSISDTIGVDTASIKFIIDGNEVSGLTIRALSVSQCGFDYTPISQLKRGTHSIKIEARDTKGVLSVKELTGLQVSASAALVGKPMNYPNPFKPQSGEVTKISYTLTDDAPIEMIIFDLAGRQVKKLFFSAGTDGGKQGLNEPVWDGSSTLSGDKAANGVYIYYIRSQGQVLGSGEIAIND